jgi:hypothetical protein
VGHLLQHVAGEIPIEFLFFLFFFIVFALQFRGFFVLFSAFAYAALLGRRRQEEERKDWKSEEKKHKDVDVGGGENTFEQQATAFLTCSMSLDALCVA